MSPVPPLQLVPSLLAADFANLGNAVAQAVAAGANRLQIDVMDGHFVPNLTMGPATVSAVRRLTTLPLEAHLMVEHPERWVQPFADAGADVIIVHAEATPHLERVLDLITQSGKRPAVALNPASPLVLIEEVLTQVTMVLLMTVNPGFGGQQFIPEVLPKIRRLREQLQTLDLQHDIEVDGGIDTATIGRAAAAGANVFVAGSSVYGAKGGVQAGLDRLRIALTAK
ncbi:MAG: ribulose-phosphate 3-epimerase [Terriglobales bacterium]